MKTLSAAQVVAQKHKTIPLTGLWHQTFGDMPSNFKMLLMGPPKSGKSTVGLAFLNAIAHAMNKPVLYIPAEEMSDKGLPLTVTKRCMLVNAATVLHPKMKIASTAMQLTDEASYGELSKYAAVMIDSVQAFGLSREIYDALKYTCPNTGFIFVSQLNNKNRSGQRHIEHDVDVLCKVLKGEATVESRYIGKRVVQVFNTVGQSIKLLF